MEDSLVRTLKVKGRATRDALISVLGGGTSPTIDQLAADGLIEETRLGYRLTEAGKDRARELFADDQAQLGDAGRSLYDAFTEVNADVKQVVTDWQLRTVGSDQAINDHTDAAYDAGVIARLGEAHRAVTPTLAALADRIDRYLQYQARLDAALAAIDAGDTTFVASPAIDSYHTVWFELHEDLILSTGRTRAEESLVGRG